MLLKACVYTYTCIKKRNTKKNKFVSSECEKAVILCVLVLLTMLQFQASLKPFSAFLENTAMVKVARFSTCPS